MSTEKEEVVTRRSIACRTVILKRQMMSSIRKRGLIASLNSGINLLVPLFWLERNVFKFHIITMNAYKLANPLPNIELREARAEDYPELSKFSVDFSKQEMFDRLALNHKCFVAKAEGRIVFYGWIGMNKVYVPVLEKQLNIPVDTVHVYNTFAEEKYRGRRILLAFISLVREFCQEHNYPFGFTLIDPEKGLPVRAYMKSVGADKVFLIRYQRRFGIKSYSEQEISPKEMRE